MNDSNETGSANKDRNQLQREAIERHLTKHILADSVPITDPNSFFQIEPPQDDVDAREIFERAQGSPGLYAIYWAMDHVRHRLEEASRNDDPAGVEVARNDLVELTDLEQAYLHPEDNPFYEADNTPVDAPEA